MSHDFHPAFKWHIETTGASLTDISKATGVSLDVLKKLKSRDGSSTTVDNAVLIASFFGKTVNQFVAMEDADAATILENLASLLSPEEQKSFAAQIRGVLAERKIE